jgi:hypothetical protein
MILTFEQYPVCVKCNMSVQQFSAQHDPIQDFYIMIAECHGSREVVIVPMQIIREANRMEIGPAFAEGDSHE